MSALGTQVFANKTRGFWFPQASTIGSGGGGGGSTVSTFNTASVSSLTVSSINGATPGGGGGTVFPELSVNNLSVSSINGTLLPNPQNLLGYTLYVGQSTTSSEGSVDINFDKPYEADYFSFVTITSQTFSPELLYVTQKNLSNFSVTAGSNTTFNWMTIGK
jgi:hypothetical protein